MGFEEELLRSAPTPRRGRGVGVRLQDLPQGPMDYGLGRDGAVRFSEEVRNEFFGDAFSSPMEDKIETARQRVASGKAAVERQRALVAEKRSQGVESTASEQLFETLERALVVFEDELAATIKRSRPVK